MPPPFDGLLMPAPQVFHHIRQIQPLILQQHQQVIHQIRRFILQLELVMHRCGQRGLHAFFSHLLRYPLVPLAYSFAVYELSGSACLRSASSCSS